MTAASVPRSCLKDTSNTAPHSNNKQDAHIDLATLMHSVDRLFVLSSPFVTSFKLLEGICRWNSPAVTASLLILVNATCLLLPAGYRLAVAWSLLAGFASLGYLHMKTGCLVKIFPNPNFKTPIVILGLDDQQGMDHAQLMQQFKTLLLYINTVVRWCCCLLTEFYRVLKWENPQLSSCVYAVTGVLLGCLHLLPFRWNVAVIIDACLLYIPTKEYVIHQYHLRTEAQKARAAEAEKMRKKKAVVTLALTPDSEPNSNSVLQRTSGSSDSVYSKESDSEMSEKAEGDSSEYSENDSIDLSTEVKDTEVKKSGVMGKIRELKKKRQAAAMNCTGCGVTFTTILKRRHLCTSCGYQYCSKCCSQKVPKKLFGATSPSAQTETVLVCQQCHIFLTGTTKESSL